jgi:hypothetical protein
VVLTDWGQIYPQTPKIGGTSPNGWNFLKNPHRIGIHHARKMTVGCPLHAAG